MSMMVLRWMIAAILALPLLGASAWAGAPTDQVRQYTDQVVKVLEDQSIRQADKKAVVRRLAGEIFDVRETAKRALGPHWQGRTEAEREEFVGLFADLLERAYINKIDLYGGERVQYTNELVDGDYATVRAKIVTKQRGDVAVDVRLLRRADRWWAYDVYIENISLVGNYRTQFDRIIRTSSYQDLVKRLKTQRDEFIGKKPSPATKS